MYAQIAPIDDMLHGGSRVDKLSKQTSIPYPYRTNSMP
jgi:hypothetical protein